MRRAGCGRAKSPRKTADAGSSRTASISGIGEKGYETETNDFHADGAGDGIHPAVRAANADPSDESYVNAAGEDMGMKYCTHVNDGETNWSGDTTDGWYALTTTWNFDNTIYVNGTVNLILCDGFTLNAKKGIVLTTGSHLIIWAQSGGTGKIVAYGADYCPGIGGNADSGDSGNLTINGGEIQAFGGIYAPALGSCGGNSGVITVNGGRVHANGGHIHDTNDGGAPGIGASNKPNGSAGTMNDIWFYGGETTAYRGAGNYAPIGDSTNSTGCIHLAGGMKLEYASLNGGKLTSYDLGRVVIEPENNAGPAYTVGTSFDAALGTVTTTLPMARRNAVRRGFIVKNIQTKSRNRYVWSLQCLVGIADVS